MPTQDSHDGDRSKRRAPAARFISGPYTDSHGSSPAYQPAPAGISSSIRSGRTVMNAVPRGDSSHL